MDRADKRMSVADTGAGQDRPFDEQDVAVIGMAGRFPGARNLREHWKNLRDGVEPITFYSREDLAAEGVHPSTLGDPDYVRAASVLEDADLFDASFFGYSPTEAELMDPQSRVFLECAWEALESAAYDSGTYPGSIGVYASQSLNTYLLRNVAPGLDYRDFILSGRNLSAVVANGTDFLCTRVSYKLNLRGPSMTVQSACSSSLVAIHMARQAVIAGECDMALAGGVSIYLPQKAGYRYQDGMILSPDGHCRPFDARAGGTVFGRGVGVVVLKPLADAVADGDFIHAVIRGSAVNNDGSNKVGYTAPSVQGQAEVIAEALANADVEPESIGYIEAHGTGTAQGDPIEIAALKEAFPANPQGEPYCGLGTLKSNLGHLDAAAGVAGFIKAVLMLEHGELPPSLHFEAPNPQIDFSDGPFYVNTVLKEWKPGRWPRRAGVSSFGIGGTNAHVILEEPPRRLPRGETPDRPAHVLGLSAKSEAAVQELALRYEERLRNDPDLPLGDVCYTAHVGRRHFDYRAAVVGSNAEELLRGVRAVAAGKEIPGVAGTGKVIAGRPSLAFLFTGQGAQCAGMGRELFESEPGFRETLERCEEILRPHLDTPLLSVMYGSKSELLNQTAYTQPALFALEYALSELWKSWGVTPDTVMGHSAGEFVAACVAGVFSLEDGLKLIAERGRLMQSLPREGVMAAVFADEATVLEHVRGREGDLFIAAVNGPANVVISGRDGAVDAVLRQLEARGVSSKRLRISNAFHSPLVDPILDEFERAAEKVTFAMPGTGFVSNLTGERVSGREVTRPEYWRRHMREPVRYARGIATLCGDGYEIFLEVGPHPTLLGMARESCAEGFGIWLPSLRRGRGDWEQLFESLGGLYVAGIGVDWQALDHGRSRRRLPLPTYPFQRQRFWLEETAAVAGGGAGSSTVSGPPAPCDGEAIHPLLGRRISSPLRETQFETSLSREALPYLADHVVHGMAVLPATAYLEMVLAAATEVLGAGQPVLRDVRLIEALVLPEGEPQTVQFVCAPEGGGAAGFQVFNSRGAAGSEEEWVLHAEGSLSLSGSETPASAPPVTPDEVMGRCGEVLEGQEFYRSLERGGFEYGPAFQGVEKIWRRDGEALAKVRCPEGLSVRRESYRVHPALLDACLQPFFAALPDLLAGDGEGAAYLPVGFGSFTCHGTDADSLWSHVRLQKSEGRAGGAIEGDITVFEESGRVAAEVRGLKLQPASRKILDRAATEETRKWLYRVQWLPQAGPCAEGAPPVETASPAAIAEAILPRLQTLRAENGMELYDELLPELDSLCGAFAAEALLELGCSLEPRERIGPELLVEKHGCTENHRPMLGRLLEMLEEDGLLRRLDREWWEVTQTPVATGAKGRRQELQLRFPAMGSELTMLGRCGEALAAVLQGQCDPLQLLFPGGSPSDLENLYRNAPFTRTYNALVREAVSRALADSPAGATVRILEVGAGTGGTTSWVLPRLAARNVEYTFTDLSSLFLNRAKQRFGEYPFVSYQLLDIGKDPVEQGFSPNRFDVVLATNVLHATSDLRETIGHVRSLLAPDGLLVAVEGVRRQRWVDLIFGLTEGWWAFRDTELRPSYPLVPASAWRDLLAEAGFRESTTVPGADDDPSLFAQAVILGRGPAAGPAAEHEGEAPSSSRPARKWLVFADEGGTGAGLARELASRGDACTVVRAGDGYACREDGRFQVRPDVPSDYHRLLREAGTDGAGFHGAVFLWALDDRPGDRLSGDGLRHSQVRSCAGALHLVQALAASAGAMTPRLWLVTGGSQAVNEETALMSLPHASLWGLGKGIGLEHPEMGCTRLDLDPWGADSVPCLLAELAAAGPEDQVAYREGTRYVARLVRCGEPDPPGRRAPAPGRGMTLRLETATPGVLDSLRMVPAPRRPPGPREVEIAVKATGLNFKDVLIALGTYPGEGGPLGVECAGKIAAVGPEVPGLEPGQSVMALAPGSFGPFTTTDAELVVPIPRGLGFEEAATIPSAFLTAHFALHHLAKMKPGERVLIHAAAGGVGMAAVQLARAAGAEVFATAGSPRKRELLHSLGVAHVFDSRSLAFADGVLAATEGEGVDIVLNSLSGDFIAKSFSVLKEKGRFLEMGKRGRWDESQAKKVRPLAAYCVIDVADVSRTDPALIRGLFLELLEKFELGLLRPLPRRVFSVADAAAAFRFMAEARHAGKIVLKQDASAAGAEAPATGLRPDGTYLLTGGLGDLGILVARWMVREGARSLVLLGRSAPKAAAREAVEEMERQGARIVVAAADVADRDQVAKVLADIDASLPPLRGIVHGAGVLDDGVLVHQNWQRFRKVMGPKVDGAWILHELTRERPLDFFTMFSSIASLLGSPGQANHSAANAFMDALAYHRRALGLRSLSINWGAWSEIGAAAERDVLEQLARRGISPISPRRGAHLFPSLFGTGAAGCNGNPQIAVLPIDWPAYLAQFSGQQGKSAPPFFSRLASAGSTGPEPAAKTEAKPTVRQALAEAPVTQQKEVLQAFLRDCIVERLRLDPAAGIDPGGTLSELGLDSLLAVELRSIFGASLGLKRALPSTLLFDYPTLDALTDYVAAEVLHLEGGSSAGGAGEEEKEAVTVLAEVEQLSDDEAEKMLLEELESGRKGD